MTPPDGRDDGRTRTVELPARTVEAVAERISGTEFDSPDEYVAFALAQLLRELDRADGDGSRPGPEDDDASRRADADTGDAPDQAVADRLESLGYR